MSRKILITGCAGLLGSNLSHWILQNTDDIIIGVDNLSGGYIENISKESDRFYFHKINIESDELDKIFKLHKPDYVFHAAAYAAECLSPFIRKYNVINNMLATSSVINNCINYNVKRLVFTSTMAVYGEGDKNPPFDEKLVPCPIDSYGIAKYACEMDIKVAGEQHGLDWCIIRPHNLYGTYQAYNDRYRNVLGIWMYKYLNGLPLTIFGDGKQTRAFSYIDDSLPCFYYALINDKCSKEIINLGGIHESTILNATNILVDVFNETGNEYGTPEIIHTDKRHEVFLAYPTYQKSIDLLGFEHKIDLKEGLTKMWNWVKSDYKIHKRKQLTFDAYEVETGIYSFWKNK